MEELFRLIRDENDIDKALDLIHSGYVPDPSYGEEYRTGILTYAVYRQSLPLVKALVENGLDVNGRSPTGATPLMQAVKINVINIAKYLLEKGAEIDAHDEEGRTARLY